MDVFYSLNTILISGNCTNLWKTSSTGTVIPNKYCRLIHLYLQFFSSVPFHKACAMVCPSTVPWVLARPLWHKINHMERTWTKQPSLPDKRVIYWQDSQFIQAKTHGGRQLSLMSLGFSAFPALHFLPKQGSSLTPLPWVFLGGHPQAQSHLFRTFPKFLTSPSVSRTTQPQQKQSKCPQDTQPTSENWPRQPAL